MSKNVPNPNGKKGGKDHQDKVNELADQITKSNLVARREFFVEVFNGLKNRFVDVATLDKVTLMPIAFYQVGKQNQDGTPVKRERLAILDIETLGA
jgi:hypothetical protein